MLRNISTQEQTQQFLKSLKHSTSQRNFSAKETYLKQTQIRVGKYKFSIQDQLGKGYSSKVYKGVQIGNSSKKYAIKAVDLKKFRGTSLQLLDTQICIHMSLDHQNVIKCYQVIKTPQFYYIILQYCAHGNLSQLIRQKPLLPQRLCLKIMNQILCGYKYLLANDIIHRDLKPDNIMRQGSRWKIGDFGFAVRTKFEFKDRINVGTTLYMSHQALTRNCYSFKTDLFALGITFFEMFTGRIPWNCQTEEQLIQKLKQNDITFPHSFKNSHLKNFIIKCCQNQQMKRFTKEEFLRFQTQNIQNIDNTAVLRSQQIYSQKSQFYCVKDQLYVKQLMLSKRTQQSSKNSFEEVQKQNNQILRNEFQFCKLLYFMIKNIQSFLFSQKDQQTFILTVFKHLLKLLKMLSNPKQQFFNLKNFQEYKKSRSYQTLIEVFTQQSIKYEKQYLIYLKKIDVASIRYVNRKFSQLANQTASLTQVFYSQMQKYIIQKIRHQNHQISLFFFEKQTNKYQHSIQGLNSLHTYLKGIQVKKNNLCDKNNDQIEMQKIKVTQNYHQTKLTISDYINLRKCLRSI